MQKKIFYILLSCILSNLCTAQNYVPFDFNNGLWEEEYYNMQHERSNYNYFTDGDTIINNLNYKKLYKEGSGTITYGYSGFPPITWTPFFELSGFIREDSNKKIYYKSGFNGSTEELLYDFNIALGDTIPIPSIHSMFDSAVVVVVDSILVCATMRKRYKLAPVGTGLLHDLYWTEGVGSTHGLIPIYNWFESGATHMCYSDGNCTSCPTYSSTTSIENQASTLATIYPNPSAETSIIQLNNKASSSKIQIMNNLGQIILNKTTNNQEEIIDLAQWSSGLYYVRIEYNQQVEIHTLIKQ
jgi:hypothetical protein